MKGPTAGLLLVVAIALAAPPAAAGEDAFVAVGMPFDGGFDPFDSSDPSDHGGLANDDWATDLPALDVPVRARFGPASGTISLAVTYAQSAFACSDGSDLGGGVDVTVSVDGVELGSVDYVHLVDIPAELLQPGPHPIPEGAVIGRTAPSHDTFPVSPCWQVTDDVAVHAHLGVEGLAAHGCYRVDNQGYGVREGDVLGVFGAGYADGPRQPCPRLPDTGPAAVSRLAGSTRQQTAATIATTAYPQRAFAVFVAHEARGLALALAMGTQSLGPTLLAGSSVAETDAAVRAAVEALDPEQVLGLSAPGAELPFEVVEDLAGSRFAGGWYDDDVFAVAAAAAVAVFPPVVDAVYLTESVRLADGLAGGTLGGPLLLVPGSGEVPGSVTDAIAALNPGEVVALGGPAAVGDDVLAAAAGSRPTRRIAGPSRFETAEAVALDAFPLTAGRAYLTRADIAPDAAVGGALTGGPILLVETCRADGTPPPIHPATARQLARLQPAEVVALGGTAAVCDPVLAAAAALAR